MSEIAETEIVESRLCLYTQTSCVGEDHEGVEDSTCAKFKSKVFDRKSDFTCTQKKTLYLPSISENSDPRAGLPPLLHICTCTYT